MFYTTSNSDHDVNRPNVLFNGAFQKERCVSSWCELPKNFFNGSIRTVIGNETVILVLGWFKYTK